MPSLPGRVSIRLLGRFSVQGPSGPLHLESAKTGALLAYLALAPGKRARAKLQRMFWPDVTDERAARNLRHAIWDLRRTFDACGARVVTADRSDLAFAASESVVVDALELLAARDALRRGADPVGDGGAIPTPPWRGELLDGTFIQDAPAFEEWLAIERERLRAAAVEVLRALVAGHRQRGELDAALEKARELVALDPWREDAHRVVMDVLALAGDVPAALAQFEQCRRILAAELQTAPSAETTRLAASLRGATGVGEPPCAALVRHNLPAQITPFFGRESEIESLERLLATPDCRLVCLLGPGGIGKTRLAVQLGLRRLVAPVSAGPRYDGVWFIAPQEGGERGGLAEALAKALFAGTQSVPERVESEERVLDFLRSQRALLILDGFEHSLSQTHVLGEFLAGAPLLSILVTSRVRLPLEGAWTIEVSGLGIPPLGGRGVERSAACQLFLETARRVRSGFSPTPRDLGDIASLCQAVEGFPLAIELAAGWIGSLSVHQISAEAKRHPGFLGEPGSGLRAVFASSWSRLDDADRAVLACLSVFSGGLSREAAETVAGASPPTLRRLVDSSFVRLEATGRYTIHEVLRHFALDELGRVPAAHEQAHRAHAEFFARRLRTLLGVQPRSIGRTLLDEVAEELDNIQVAWRWALASARPDVIADCLGSLVIYAQARAWMRAAEALITEAIDVFTGGDPCLCLDLLVARGTLRTRMGRYSLAREDLQSALRIENPGGTVQTLATVQLGACAYYQGRHEEARALLDQAVVRVGRSPAGAMCRVLSGRVALEQGRHDDAEFLFETARSIASEVGDSANDRLATIQLGMMAYFRGDLERADRLFGEVLASARAAGDTVLMEEAATGLGIVREAQGAFDAARSHYEEALALCRESGNRRGEAYVLTVIGETFRSTGEIAQARRLYTESLIIAREIGADYLMGLILGNLAYVDAAAGHLDEAEATVQELLRWHQRGASVATALPAIISAAEILHRRGASARALELLGLVRAHPANRQDHASEVERVLNAIVPSVSPRTLKRRLRIGTLLDFETEVGRLAEPGSLQGNRPERHAGTHSDTANASVFSAGRPATRGGPPRPVR